MILRCGNCGEGFELKSRAAIKIYMKGEYAIGCRKCGMTIWNKAALNGKEKEEK